MEAVGQLQLQTAEERRRAYMREWRLRNREKLREYQRVYTVEWRNKNRAAVNDRINTWKRSNRERVYDSKRRRSATLRKALIEKLGGCCAQCGSDRRIEFDHIHGTTVDLRRLSGYDRIRLYQKEIEQGLIQLLCKKCNQKKGRPEAPAEVDQPDEVVDAPF